MDQYSHCQNSQELSFPPFQRQLHPWFAPVACTYHQMPKIQDTAGMPLLATIQTLGLLQSHLEYCPHHCILSPVPLSHTPYNPCWKICLQHWKFNIYCSCSYISLRESLISEIQLFSSEFYTEGKVLHLNEHVYIFNVPKSANFFTNDFQGSTIKQ